MKLILIVVLVFVVSLGGVYWYYLNETVGDIILMGEPVVLNSEKESIDFFIPLSPSKSGG